MPLRHVHNGGGLNTDETPVARTKKGQQTHEQNRHGTWHMAHGTGQTGGVRQTQTDKNKEKRRLGP
eukprot:scaffold11999_cov88-Phaeocystis_antarctica.AAC.1